jgi:hypothetical protein
MTKFSNKKAGFVKIVLLVVAALVILKYLYDIDIIGSLTQGRFRELLLDKFYKLAVEGWDKYKDTILRVKDYIIEFAKNILGKIKK